VYTPEDERILVLEILPVRGHGARDLVVELLGNQWNALVVERPSGTLRHVLVRREGPRPARVGIPYLPPPTSPRKGTTAPLSLEQWREALEPVPPSQRRKALVAAIAWTSPLNAAAFVDGDPSPDRALLLGHALWIRLAHGSQAPEPAVLDLERGRQPYPWPLPGVQAEACTTLLDALQRVVGAGGQPAGTAPAGSGETDHLIPPEVLSGVERTLDGYLRRSTRLQAELDGLEDEGVLRSRADLLLARFSLIPAGASTVTLAGFDDEPVTMTLDPGLTVHENAGALYDRAAKVVRARKRIPGLLARVREQAATLEALLERARRGETTADELRAALPAKGTSPVAPEGGALPPYRSYRSSGGLEIRVGRGARFNDDLTFRHSAPGDAWLHARHTAGAHVILRWAQTGNPPARDLEEAAILAALHSKARTAGTVPVDWTLRKYVRKPRGSAPGSVVPKNVKTLMVRPDARLLEKLAVE
jgi:predicted ribosome quality control (RQC) complex YloA/Tae2 family protein